jgi:hypothetical protein
MARLRRGPREGLAQGRSSWRPKAERFRAPNGIQKGRPDAGNGQRVRAGAPSRWLTSNFRVKRLRLGRGVAAGQERGALSTGLRAFGARRVRGRAGTASNTRRELSLLRQAAGAGAATPDEISKAGSASCAYPTPDGVVSPAGFALHKERRSLARNVLTPKATGDLQLLDREGLRTGAALCRHSGMVKRERHAAAVSRICHVSPHDRAAPHPNPKPGAPFWF